tara:strand:+ start:1121 stop:1459 length:339 start_codon:yes stop_codon:yes gene_type:complete
MIRLLKFLTELLNKPQLYELAMFMSDNPDIIDQETLLEIINEVNGFENKPEYKDMINFQFEEHFKKMDTADNADGTLNIKGSMSYDDFMEQKRKGEEKILKKLLGDNNISLN